MTTKIDVIIKGIAELLQKIKEVQDEERKKYEEAKRKKKEKEKAEKEAQQEEEDKDDEYKGAIAETEEEEEPENRPKSRKCGHWMYKDFTYGQGTSDWQNYDRATYDGPDIFQVSIGSGDGVKWETHYFQAPSGKPTFESVVTGSMDFVGYLSYMQFYEPGSGFGTVYTLPEGAIETPYDPVVYLNPFNPPSSCPDGFCWQLYFPDELSSGPGRSRKTVTLTKKLKPVNSTEVAFCNQNQFCFPINNKKSVVIIPSWVHWSRGSAGEIYSAAAPGEFFLHPQNISQPSIRYTVYYKNPGGANTGWTPINGFYWLMNPADETQILTMSQLGQIFPLSTTITHNHAGKYEIAGFVVSHKNVKKLESIPEAVEAKIRARCPEPYWDDSNIYWASYTESMRELNDKTPGYPSEIDDIYNNVSWMMNPDAHCMGVARNLFYPWEYDGDGLPYDYWNRDGSAPSLDAFYPPLTLGISPGIYDSYDADLQDHAFYNHFGKGSWYDSWGFTYSTRDTWTSEYGDVRLHTQDVLLNQTPNQPKNAWYWFYNIRSVTSELDGPGYSRWHITKSANDIAWMYLNTAERQAFLDNYTDSETDTEAILDYALSAPDHAEFNYMYYAKNDNPANLKLQNGVKWISEGGASSWVDADAVEFDYNADPFYDQPYMEPDDPHWRRYKLKHKLSQNRMWPPSVSAGIDEPIPANANLSAKANHPLAKGNAIMTLMINTAWDNDYSQVLLDMGFTAEDLAI